MIMRVSRVMRPPQSGGKFCLVDGCHADLIPEFPERVSGNYSGKV